MRVEVESIMKSIYLYNFGYLTSDPMTVVACKILVLKVFKF